MPSAAADLLDELTASCRETRPPWGSVLWLDAPEAGLTVKHLAVAAGRRTSLQLHERKDELLVITGGTGFVQAGGKTYQGTGCAVRIPPGMLHRVTGPLSYLEVSSYDDDTDTIRLEDDYGRVTG